MSRTIKGSKGAGYDYWSRRPMSGHGYGPEVKRICHGVERMQAKQAARDGVADLDAMLMNDDSRMVRGGR